MRKCQLLFFVFSFFGWSLSVLKGQQSPIQVQFSADYQSSSQQVFVDISLKIDPKIGIPLDTLWFQLGALAYSDHRSEMAKRMSKRGNNELYFTAKSDLAKVEDLVTQVDGKEAHIVRKKGSSNFGIIVKSAVEGPINVDMNYMLFLPKRMFGFGYQKDIVALQYFLPALIHQGWTGRLEEFDVQETRLAFPMDVRGELTGVKSMKVITPHQVTESPKGFSLFAQGVQELGFVFYRDSYQEVWKGAPANNHHIFIHKDVRWSNSRADDLNSMFALYQKNWNDKLRLNQSKAQILMVERDRAQNFFGRQMSGVIDKRSYGRSRKKGLTDFHIDLLRGTIYSAADFMPNDRALVEALVHQAKSTLLRTSFRDFYGNAANFPETAKQSLPYLVYGQNRLWDQDSLSTCCEEEYLQNLAKISYIYAHKPSGVKFFETVTQNARTPLTIESIRNAVEATKTANEKWTIDLKSIEQTCDYILENVGFEGQKIRCTIKNVGTEAPNFTIFVGFKEKTKMYYELIPGFIGTKEIVLEGSFDAFNMDFVQVDNFGVLPDLNRQNQTLFFNPDRGRGSFTTTSLVSSIIPNTPSMRLSPWLGYTYADKTMAGLVFSNFNRHAPAKTTYLTQLGYALGSKSLVGQGFIRHTTDLEAGMLKGISAHLGVKSYGLRYQANDLSTRYVKLDPTIRLHFTAPGDKNVVSSLTAQHFMIWRESLDIDGASQMNPQQISRLSYQRSKTSSLRRSSFLATAEYQSYDGALAPAQKYLQISVSQMNSWKWNRNSATTVRIFAGGFLTHSNRNASEFEGVFASGSLSLVQDAAQDYTFDEIFLDRGQQSRGFISSMVSPLRAGGFKTDFGNDPSVARSNNWLSSINVYSNIPFLDVSWIQVYGDFGVVSSYDQQADKFEVQSLWSGGLCIGNPNVAAFYLPVISSSLINAQNPEASFKNVFNASFSINFSSYKF